MPAAASVIIPCFNRERFIVDAIEGALSQGSDVEVVVVDDGSTDRSWDLISGYRTRLVTVRSKCLGPAGARNRGLAAATGRFVHFLDSDDRLLPGALTLMIEAAEELAPKHVAVGDSVDIDSQGRRTGMASRGYCALPSGPLCRAT